MGVRLYDSAWVRLEGHDAPLRVSKDEKNPSYYIIGDHKYDIDGRAISSEAPKIAELLSLQSAKEAGLKADYNRDVSEF
jgi:hypothetical protein